MDNTQKYLRIAEIIAARKSGENSHEEELILEEWINESDENRTLFEKLKNESNLSATIEIHQSLDSESAWNNIISKAPRHKVFSLNQFLKYAAVILFPLIIGGISFWYFNQLGHTGEVASVEMNKSDFKKATLTLSSGRTVELKNERGLISEERNVLIQDTASTLSYELVNKNIELAEESVIAKNTLRTPRGGEYSLVLSDGTKVWLNAESALTFPVEFKDSVRAVQLIGEAYFEVKKDAEHPFIVALEGMNVKVLGTSFNISAYPSESSIKTTLVEGKVAINTLPGKPENRNQVLRPGQQAAFNFSEQKLTIAEVDINIFTAWKDGKFVFENKSLADIAATLGRWYDIEFEFDSQSLKNNHFTGNLDKYDNPEKILNLIAKVTDVQFERENNKIIIKKSN